MVPPLTVLEEAFFSTGTLGLGVVSLIPSITALCSKRARSHLRAGIATGLVMSGMVVLPLAADFLYPYHVMNASTSCFPDHDSSGWLPHGLLRHSTSGARAE